MLESIFWAIYIFSFVYVFNKIFLMPKEQRNENIPYWFYVVVALVTATPIVNTVMMFVIFDIEEREK